MYRKICKRLFSIYKALVQITRGGVAITVQGNRRHCTTWVMSTNHNVQCNAIEQETISTILHNTGYKYNIVHTTRGLGDHYNIIAQHGEGGCDEYKSHHGEECWESLMGFLVHMGRPGSRPGGHYSVVYWCRSEMLLTAFQVNLGARASSTKSGVE